MHLSVGVTPLSCNQALISTEVAHQPVHHARAPAADPCARRTPAERASRCATHRPPPRRKPACPRSACPTAHSLRYAPCGARDPRHSPQRAGAIQRCIHQGGRIGLALVSGDAAPWPRKSERRLGRLPSSDHRARLASTNIAPVTTHRIVAPQRSAPKHNLARAPLRIPEAQYATIAPGKQTKV